MNARSIVVLLLGHPGVGKLSVARALAPRLGARVIDNHTFANPIFVAMREAGKPMPDAVWPLVRRVRTATLEAMETLAPPHWNFVLTSVFYDGEEWDRRLYEDIVNVARRRGAAFFPVRLTCAEPELARRAASPSREERMKLTVAEEVLRLARNHRVMAPAHPNALSLDTTDLAPEAVAALVAAHVEAARPGELRLI